MKKSISSVFALLLPLALADCGPADETAGNEVESVGVSQEPLTWAQMKGAWSAASATVSAIDALYKGLQWANCNAAQMPNCPTTEAMQAAQVVIDKVTTSIESGPRFELMGKLNALLSRAKRDYNDLATLGSMGSAGEEAALVNDTEELFELYVAKLGDATSPTDAAQVETAYMLAPAFNILAAFLDNLGRIQLVRKQAPMTLQVLSDYRVRTLATNEGLVGAQSLWYSCSGGTPAPVSTVATWNNAFTAKKLWKLFADKSFYIDSCSNDCNVFRGVSGGAMCRRNCTIFCLDVCGLTTNEAAFRMGAPAALDEMARDAVVQTVRIAMDRQVAVGYDRGAGLLFRKPSGEMSVLQMKGGATYTMSTLSPAGTSWTPVTTGDFDGDGDGDILWTDRANLSLWLLQDRVVKTMTPGTDNAPFGTRAFAGEMNGDGVSDVVWDIGDYTTYDWQMSAGSTIPAQQSLAIGSETVQGLGSFNRFAPGPGPFPVQKLMRSNSHAMSILDFSGNRNTLPNTSSDWVVKGTGDFNRDTGSDVVFYNVNSGAVAIWTISGNQFRASFSLGTVAPSTGLRIQRVADIDHDGVSDIVWRNQTSGAVSFWLMKNESTIRENTQPFPMAATTEFVGTLELGPTYPANAASATVNASFCNQSAGHLRMPGFANYEPWWNNSFYGRYGTFLEDVNLDSKADLVAVGDGYIGVIPSTGSGFGTYSNWYSATGFTGGTKGTKMGDLTGDGISDVVLIQDNRVQIYKSTGSTFASAGIWYNGIFDYGLGTFAADVDGDRRTDLITFTPYQIDVLRSKGNGFDARKTWYTGTPFSSGVFGVRQVHAADMSGDGKADLVAVGTGGIALLRANANGTFEASRLLTTSSFLGTRGNLMKDVTGDGRADLVALDDDKIRIRRSMIDYFAEPETYWMNPFYGSRGTLIGDIDGTRRADLVALGDGFVGAIRSQ